MGGRDCSRTGGGFSFGRRKEGRLSSVTRGGMDEDEQGERLCINEYKALRRSRRSEKAGRRGARSTQQPSIEEREALGKTRKR